MAGADAENFQLELRGRFADGGDRFLLQRGVGNYAARADVFARQFELRFDEDEEVGAGSGRGCGAWQNFGRRNEGDVDCDEIDRLGDIVRAQVASIAGY